MKKRLRHQMRQYLRMLHPLEPYAPWEIAEGMGPFSNHKKRLVREALERMSLAFADPNGITDVAVGPRWWGFQWQAATNPRTRAIPWSTVPIAKSRLADHYPDLAVKLGLFPDFLVPPHLLPSFYLGIQVWLLVEPDQPGRKHLNRKRLSGGFLLGMPPTLRHESLHPGWRS